jgi:hypothetical protein
VLVVLQLLSAAPLAGCAPLRSAVVERPAATRPAGRILYPALLPWRVVTTGQDCGNEMADFPRWGYIDRSGALVVGPLLESAGEFREGLAPVRVDLECVAIGPDKRMTERLSEGFRQWRAGKRTLPPSDERYCLIDTDGRVAVGPLERDDSISEPMSCGVAMVRRGEIFDHFGYVDADGRWILAPGAPEAHPFSEGLARVRLHGLKGGRIGAFFLAGVRFLSQTGAVAFDQAFEDAGDFSEGLARVQVKSKWGYIDKSGKLVIAPRFAYAGDFSEGMASVVDENGNSGFIDRSGAVVIAPRFKMAGRFCDGLASVWTDNWRQGYIDRSGAWAVPAEYEYAADFSGGLAMVGRSGKYGYIDRRGTVVVALTYDEANPLVEGMGRVCARAGDKQRYGFVDSQGKVTVPPQYHSANDFHNGLAFVSLDPEHYAYIDKQGTLIWKSPRLRQGWFKE